MVNTCIYTQFNKQYFKLDEIPPDKSENWPKITFCILAWQILARKWSWNFKIFSRVVKKIEIGDDYGLAHINARSRYL